MTLVFHDKFNGYFRLSDAQTWHELTKGEASKHFSILFNFTGDLIIHKDFKVHSVRPGEACFISPGSYITDIELTEESHALVLDFDQNFYCLDQHDKDLSCTGLLFGAANDIALLTFDDSDISSNLHTINIIQEELERADQNTGDMIRLLLKRLIIKSARVGRTQLFKISAPTIKDTDVVRQFKYLVEQHFREKHKVGHYADLMFKSSKTLSNSFNLLQAKSPLQIIHDRIILEAKRQLIYTDLSVKEISHFLGFEDAAQFSRLFKKITSHSPSEFQKLNS